MTKETKNFIETYKLNKAELETLKTENIEDIVEKVANLEEEIFEKVFEYFDKWLFGEAPKARFNYWLKKAGLTEAEANIWATL